jgi:hypothetical protein
VSTLWSVEYRRKDGDTKERLWINAAEPKSMARADFEAARVNTQRLARALLEHKVGKVVILSCRCILAPGRAAPKLPGSETADSGEVDEPGIPRSPPNSRWESARSSSRLARKSKPRPRRGDDNRLASSSEAGSDEISNSNSKGETKMTRPDRQLRFSNG